MQRLIHNDDLKRLFTGTAIAVGAGLIVGLSFKPSLADNIVAPQQEMGVSADRTYETAATPVANYGGRVPDYVTGTQWVAQQQAPSADQTQVLAYEERVEPAAYAAAGAPSAGDYAASAEATKVTTRWQDRGQPAAEAPRYPSQQGSTYYESDLPDPPADAPSEHEPA